MAKTKAHEATRSKETKRVEPLDNWYALQDGLRACSEAEARELFAAEKDGQGRERFLKRIHARLNRLRGERERAELSEGRAR